MSCDDAFVPDVFTELLASCAALPRETVDALFARYGHPLDEAPVLDPIVTFADGVTQVGRFRFRAPVDVIANDHFVLLRPDQEASAMPGPLFAAAVAALARNRANASAG